MINVYNTANKDTRTVNWQLSLFCEKNCHYCTSWDAKYTIARGKNTVSYSDEHLAIHDNIFNHLTRLDSGIVMLYGGEPTLHPRGIEYFNRLCQDSVDNSKTIFLVTHGDIDYEKIYSIDPGEKDSYVISISYHYLQVKFEEWFEKVKLFHSRLKVMVSAVIPRQKRIQKQFRQNIYTLLEAGINVELKLEFDRNLDTSVEDYETFKDLIDLANGRNIYLERHAGSIMLEDGKSQYEINIVAMMLGIPIIKGRTFCANRQFGISSRNILSASCSQGKHYEITADTSWEEFNEYLSENSNIMCTRHSCTENRHDISSLRIMGDLEMDVFQEFLRKAQAEKIKG